MDRGAVIRRSRSGALRAAVTLAVLLALLALPSAAAAAGATLIEPADGHHYDHLDVAPMLQIEPSKDAAGKVEQPKWILIATDRGMKATVRYCRAFVWAMSGGAYHWGCNRWATGADQLGNDILQPLDSGKVYYWQAVSSTADGKGEVKSAVRSFAIDPKRADTDIKDITGQVHGTAFDDGSYLNLGAAALVNSGVRVRTIRSSRLALTVFRVRLSHVGDVDYSRSYIKVNSAAGTRYLRVSKGRTGIGALWRLTRGERALRSGRYTYQAFLKSRKNGAMVRSQVRVVLIRKKRLVRTAPRWTPDR